MWKQIDGFDRYFIDEYGNVLSKVRKKPIILKPDIDKDGYEVYRLSTGDGNKIAKKGHRLVAEYFLESVVDKDIVNHIDGNKRNNYYKNLEWVSNKENIRHAVETGLLTPYNRCFKITDTKTGKIVGYYHGYDVISDITGFTVNTITDIVCDKKMLFDYFFIERIREKDCSNEKLFNHKFIERTISHRNKPLKYNDKVYKGVNEIKTKVGNYSHIKKDIEFISHYEYVTYK